MDYRASKFSLRHRVVSAVSHALPPFTYTAHHGLAKGLKRHGGLGFLPTFFGVETAEENFLRSLDLQDKVVYDVGGFEGLATILFAKAAERVITYEANPENIAIIYRNVALNGETNVLVRNVAVGSREGLLRLSYDPLFRGAASGDPEISEEIQTTARNGISFAVAMVTLDEDIRRLQLPAPDFMKIDIEGMESDALTGLERTLKVDAPALFIELHGTTPQDKQVNARGVIQFLRDHGYSIYDVECARAIPDLEAPSGRESHIYCVPGPDAAKHRYN